MKMKIISRALVMAIYLTMLVPIITIAQGYPAPASLSPGEDYYLFEITSVEQGFSVAAAARLDKLKGKTIARIYDADRPDSVFWEVSMTNRKQIYVTRFRDSYDWNVTFWDPEYANYSDLPETDTVFFMIVQEYGELRLHVGMPDGKFDCMYVNFGIRGLKLENNPHNLLVRFNPQLSNDLVKHEYWNKAMCRTDAFAYTSQNYYDTPLPTTAFQLFSADAREEVYKSDSTRLNGCVSALASFESGGGARLAAEDPMDMVRQEFTPESDMDQPYVVYPNPSQGVIRVKYATDFSEPTDVSLKLFDLTGKLERSKMFPLQKNNREISWDAKAGGDLANGVYILEASTRQGVFRKKVVIYCPCVE